MVGGAGRGRIASTVIALLVLGCTSGDQPGRLAGTCYDEPPRDPDSAPTAECEDGRFEIVSVDVLEAAEDQPFPGDETLSTATFDRCLDAAEGYVDAALPDVDLDLWFHHPGEGAWDDGDRQFVCAVSRSDEGPLDGSVNGLGSGD